MTRSKEILNELTELSPLLSQAGTEMPYSVPGGYFETLDTVIMARIAAGGQEENSLLHTLDKQMPQDVPQGYFENLAGSILSKIKTTGEQSVEDELKEIAPVLVGLNKLNPYQAPGNYFETVTENILNKTNEPKVISIYSRKVWMRFAVAAAFIVFVGFGIRFFVQKPGADTVTKLPQVKTEEQIKTELAQISDEEIINYLKMTSDAKDAEVIASLVDQTQLPTEADYMDDAFLESFMKELEKTEHKTN